jgi:hypothetical protein
MVLIMKKLLKENGLTIAAMLLFLGSLIGQVIAGLHVYNEDATEHGRATLGMVAYLGSGQFIEALFENWESEFLQMGLFVVLTKYLRQKGSSESKKLEGEEEVDEDPREKKDDPEAPWPVKVQGIALVVYERSLSIALFALFLASFFMHAWGGMRAENEEQLRHGGEAVTMLGYIGSSKFWFESFQNWQSEFFSVAALVVLSIFLRERGSPQSKPVAKAHHKTEAEA